jgi:Domain of unknown function (DUF4136)
MKCLCRGIAGIVLVGLFTGCASLSVKSDFNPSVDFDSFKTFAWISEHPLVGMPAGSNPLLEQRIIDVTEELLTAKGYRYVANPGTADFVVGFAVGAEDKVRIDSYPTRYRGTWHWSPVYVQDVNVRQYTEGRLTVDIFDVATQQPAWHGWATKNITGTDPNASRTALREVLAAILAKFPPH